MAIDDGYAIDYLAVEAGTPVYSSDEQQVGVVREVLDNFTEHIFDGIVMQGADGELRFVDAPEKGPPVFKPRAGGKVSRFLGGGWKKQ